MTAKISASADGLYGALSVGANEAFRFGSDTSGQLAGFRNRLINGGMRVWQRGNSGSAPINAVTFAADRWAIEAFTTGVTWTTVGIGGVGVGGLTSNVALQINGAAGNTGADLSQKIESSNCFGLPGKQVTVSFDVFGNSGTIATSLYRANARDDWTGQTLVQSITLTPPSSSAYSRMTATFNALPDAVANGLRLYISFGSMGAEVNVSITNIQLELGSIGSLFEQRPYQVELALCQRYYQTIPDFSYQIYSTASGALWEYTLQFAPMRSAPLISAITTGTAANLSNSGWQFIRSNCATFFMVTAATGVAASLLNYGYSLSSEL